MSSILHESIVLITSNDPQNDRFGTGFVICQNRNITYIVTCAHVIADVQGTEEYVKVNNILSKVIALGSEKDIDLAVIQVEGLSDKKPLQVSSSAKTGELFTTVGFQKYSKKYICRTIDGELGKIAGLANLRQSKLVEAWNLKITDTDPLQHGYSGSPVIRKKDGCAFGVVSDREGEGKRGLAISIEALKIIWEQMPQEIFSNGESKQNYNIAVSQQTQVVYTIPLNMNLPLQTSPPYLQLPSEYLYLGHFDELQSDHLYRKQDKHITLLFPMKPGISEPFLIDKYAITAQQFSIFLNELVEQDLAKVITYPDNGINSCVDKLDHVLVFDALDYWQKNSIINPPWRCSAQPWGVTYQNHTWKPVANSELLPVTLVTWWGARLYSLWAHCQLSLSSHENTSYLPPQEQWNRAALWDTTNDKQQRYPWSGRWERLRVNYAGYWVGNEVIEKNWKQSWAENENIYSITRPLAVNSLNEGRSPLGCMQMLGNIWEWCADNFPENPRAKIVKGGACLSPQEHCDPMRATPWRPGQSSEYIGFRCYFSFLKEG